MKKSALITGITGQDGSYLAEFLLEKDYRVYGLVRRLSTPNMERIAHIQNEVELIPGDLLDQGSLTQVLQSAKPDEVYNLAAQSFVAASWNQPILTGEVTALGATRLLEAIRGVNPRIRFLQASSSEMYGATGTSPQNETTYFHPRSPYAVAKLYGHWITINYRESHSLFACCAISFNHESPRRGLEFVTRKITDGVARIKLGLRQQLQLGNTHAQRDWGYAADYVKGFWLILQQPAPEEFVLATGVCHSVQQFAEAAFAYAGLDWKEHVKTDQSLLRPADVDHLVGDPSKARRQLGWQAETSFEQLVKLMMEEDLRRVRATMTAAGAHR